MEISASETRPRGRLWRQGPLLKQWKLDFLYREKRWGKQPWAATSLTSTPSSWAMNPIMPADNFGLNISYVQSILSTEDDEASKDWGDTVAHGNHDGVPEDVVPEVVVGGEGDHSSPGHPEGEEDLDAGVSPHLTFYIFKYFQQNFLTQAIICRKLMFWEGKLTFISISFSHWGVR